MTSGSAHSSSRWLTTRESFHMLGVMILMLTVTATQTSASVILKLGDILVAEPTTSSISVVDPATGVKTVISQGGLLEPEARPSVLHSRWTVTLLSPIDERD